MRVYYPTKKYVVFDFETTGFDAKKDDVIQMSALKFCNDETSRLNIFVKTGKLISDTIKNLTGISNQVLDTVGIDKSEAWISFSEFIKDSVLIGHNSIAFDKSFLEKNFDDFDLKKPDKRVYVDTAMICKARLLNEKQRWYESHYDFCLRIKEIKAYGIKFNLAQSCENLGIDIKGLRAHSSDSDVEMTHLLYKKLCINEE